MEVTKAATRANPSAAPWPILARFAFVELDVELTRVAAATGGAGLHSLDAIHIASAQRLGREVAAFLTYDDRQATAAQELGLAVEAPGRDPNPA